MIGTGNEVRNLERFFGEFQAVKGISFEVRPGEVFGLLGPNGAGKSTTIKMLLHADVFSKRRYVSDRPDSGMAQTLSWIEPVELWS